jgi:sulfate adenylyltransferase
MSSHLIAPHGGSLVDLLVDAKRAAEIKAQAKQMPSWSLKPRQIADVELLLSGAFSPLTGFLSRADCESVLSKMQLANGTLWPLPVILDVPEDFARTLKIGQSLALRDVEGVIVAVLHVEETWRLDLAAQAQALCGSSDVAQPGPRRILRETGAWAVGGRLDGVERPHHYDFTELRLTPAALRAHFAALGWSAVTAFHTSEPMHRAEQQIALSASRDLEANVLLQLGVATSAYWETSHYARIRCLEAVIRTFPYGTAHLNLLSLAPRDTGARDLLLNAVVAQNHGCTHFLVRGGAAGAADPRTGAYLRERPSRLLACRRRARGRSDSHDES